MDLLVEFNLEICISGIGMLVEFNGIHFWYRCASAYGLASQANLYMIAVFF